MNHDSPRSAVVTGLGVIAPNGTGASEYWAAVLSGRSGIGPISRFDPSPYPVRLAGQIPGFDPAAVISSRLIVQTDHWTHLGLHATALALADADADPAALPEYDLAVVTASSSGGTEFGQREIEKLWRSGPGYVGAYQSIAWFYAATTGQISIRHGMRGPCGVISAEQAGGLDAIGHARRLLRTDARLVVTGGTDASLCPYGLVAQLSTGWLSRQEDPALAYRPFHPAACGYLPGEGGAMLVVEDAAHAEARNAPRRYGTIAGYAAAFDPAPGTGRPPALARVIEAALADAGLPPSAVDVVFADAAGVPERDQAEAAAIEAVFGPFAVPVTAPKTMTGRLYAGGGALDVATALLALRAGVIPPATGVGAAAAGLRLDLVCREPRPAPLATALVLARGYGGFNAAVVVSAAPASRRGRVNQQQEEARCTSSPQTT
jgi:act minimal PKS chain-length factor (CLF/KS beta)